MVARGEHTGDARPTPRAAHLASALFLTWRRWLTLVLLTGPSRVSRPVVRGLTAAGGAIASAGSRAGAAIERGAATLFLHWRRALAALDAAVRDRRRLTAALPVAGIAALAAGAALALALARPLGTQPAVAAVAVVWTLGWAGLRLGILRVALRPAAPADVRRAWAIGLLPAIASVNDVSRLVVLAVSAWLTARALREQGVEAREARRAVGWAFGTEVGATVLRAVASAVLLYLVAAR